MNVTMEEDSRRLTGTDSQTVQAQRERSNGVATLDHTGNGGNDHDDMGETTDGNTNADGLEASQAGVRNPATEDGKSIGHELECIHHGRGHDTAFAESASSVLRSALGSTCSIASLGKLSTDEVLEHLLRVGVSEMVTGLGVRSQETHVATVVTGTFGELDCAQDICAGRHRTMLFEVSISASKAAVSI